MPAARIAVQRADSLRSERSDASQANKRVSFNRDVDVKHINQQQQQQRHAKGLAPAPPSSSNNASAVAADRHDVPPVLPFYNVYKEPTLLSEAELAQEAERIIQQVDQISCTVSPNPLLANYETRSLERRNLAAAKRNNQQVLQQQQQPDGSAINWSRTLPTASTKNQLLDSTAASKKTKNVEKNNIQQQQLDQGNPRRVSSVQPAMTVTERQNGGGKHQNRDASTTPPKYDSGIEMEATSRPNVNLIVQQLTEEARQRELLRRQYQEEMLTMTTEDPLAPRLPTLNLIEPDPQFGLSHNKNLPFSYTGGASPTRISPLRSPPGGGRFSSPPPRPELLPGKAATATDVVYAQVNVARDRSQSPERNVFRSNGAAADKVPARGKFSFQQQQSEVIRQHLRYPDDDDEEPEEPVDEEDLDAIKAKARFLFGDDGAMHKERKLSDGRPMDVRNNNRNGITISQAAVANNHINNNNNNSQNNNNNNNATGLSFKYSTLLKDRSNGQQQQQPDPNRSYTTKILIGSDQQQQQRKRQEQRPVFQYSDEDDFGRGRGVYHDRSVSPEPRIQPLTSRIRSLQMHSSPERSYHRPAAQHETESRTLPLISKKTQNQQQVMASTRLIQEAERGRTVVRSRPAEFTSSRLVQQQSQQHASVSRHYVDDGGPPKPPLRIKKLSRERMEASPPRVTAVTKQSPSKVAFNTPTTVPWNARADPGSESSPERGSYPLPRPSTNKKMPSPYRYQPPQRSLTPSPERRIELRRWNEPGQESDTTTMTSRKGEPEKQEKIRRQRSKFLSVFLGSKANKSKGAPPSPSVIPPPPPPAAAAATVVVKSPALKAVEVRGQQAQPPVAKWSAEDEAELVRQSRSLLVKGQSHQSTTTTSTAAARVITEPPANKSTRLVHRKTSPPSAVDPRYRVVTSKDLAGHRQRRSSTDRTDTSESEEVKNHQRFKNLRQKSQVRQRPCRPEEEEEVVDSVSQIYVMAVRFLFTTGFMLYWVPLSLSFSTSKQQQGSYN